MRDLDSTRSIGYVAILISVWLYLALQLFGADIFPNGWSFTHLDSLVFSFSSVWLVGAVLLTWLALRFRQALSELLARRFAPIAVISLLMALFFIFRYDSILFAGFNGRVNQIAQHEVVVFHWYEYLSVGTAWLFYSVLDGLGVHPTSAGVWGWRLFSYLMTAIMMIGAWRLATEFSDERQRRFWYFLLIVFSGQVFSLLGYMRVESVFPAAAVWIALGIIKSDTDESPVWLLWLWLIQLTALAFHLSTIVLLPAVVYATADRLTGRTGRPVVPLFVSTAVAAAIVWGTVSVVSGNLELLPGFLGAESHAAEIDYSLFSLRHLGDLIQIILLSSPLVLGMDVLSWTYRGWFKNNRIIIALWWLCFGGVAFALSRYPSNSIVLDLPRLAVYLAPFGIMYAAILSRLELKRALPSRTTVLAAMSALLLPILILPSYLSTNQAEARVVDYLDEYPLHYRIGCIAFRDAYFYDRDFDRANYWVAQQPLRSTEFLSFRGCKDLALNDQSLEAIPVLRRLITQSPYWTEPRFLEAEIQLQLRRTQIARPLIDTILMLDPFMAEGWGLLHNYYRDKVRYDSALMAMARARELAPTDTTLMIDNMISLFRIGQDAEAGALSDSLIQIDSTIGWAFWLKGAIADRRADTARAIQFYRKYVSLSPAGGNDAEIIRRRLNDLINAQRQNSQP